jgi:hypothetical protein
MQQNKNLNNNDNIFCSLQVHHGLLPECRLLERFPRPRRRRAPQALEFETLGIHTQHLVDS